MMEYISEEIKYKYADIYIDGTIPKVFCVNGPKFKQNIQAIILRTDTLNNKELYFETVLQ